MAIAVVVASVAIYALLILYHIASYDYNLSCIMRIGEANRFLHPAALEPNLIVFNDPESGGDGYDGQYYYYIIKDFFMGDEGKANPFRSQRILYPLLAYVFALGRSELLPLSMPTVNLLAIALSAAVLWLMIRRERIRPEILLVYTLNIGFLIAVFYDVATPLCIALTVGGAYLHDRDMPWAAAAALSLAMLAQENALLVIGGFCLWLAWRRNLRGAFAIATSILPWAIWQVLLWQRYGRLPLFMSSGHFDLPFLGMIKQIAALSLPGDAIGNMRELSVYPFMLFVIVLLIVSISKMRKKPSALNLLLIAHALAGICFNQEQIWSSTITSSARALATVFPFIVIAYAREKSPGTRLLLVICILLSLMGVLRILLLPVHPFYITQ